MMSSCTKKINEAKVFGCVKAIDDLQQAEDSHLPRYGEKNCPCSRYSSAVSCTDELSFLPRESKDMHLQHGGCVPRPYFICLRKGIREERIQFLKETQQLRQQLMKACEVIQAQQVELHSCKKMLELTLGENFIKKTADKYRPNSAQESPDQIFSKLLKSLKNKNHLFCDGTDAQMQQLGSKTTNTPKPPPNASNERFFKQLGSFSSTAGTASPAANFLQTLGSFESMPSLHIAREVYTDAEAIVHAYDKVAKVALPLKEEHDKNLKEYREYHQNELENMRMRHKCEIDALNRQIVKLKQESWRVWNRYVMDQMEKKSFSSPKRRNQSSEITFNENGAICENQLDSIIQENNNHLIESFREKITVQVEKKYCTQIASLERNIAQLKAQLQEEQEEKSLAIKKYKSAQRMLVDVRKEYDSSIHDAVSSNEELKFLKSALKEVALKHSVSLAEGFF